jgi:hypothetical protein
VTGKSGISQARSRLGWEPVKQLHDEVVEPIAVKKTHGAWYKKWKLVSLDGSTLDVADSKENQVAFGRPGASRGSSAYPQIRFVSLVERHTRAVRNGNGGLRDRRNHIDQIDVEAITARACSVWPTGTFWDMSFGNKLKQPVRDLLWRGEKHLRLEREKELPDGSYLSRIYPSERDWRKKTNGIRVRVIEYTLEGVPDAEPLYRLVTTTLDHAAAPAAELAALYHERWEIETALDELKTHLRGAQIVLRSKTPDLVKQEFYGFMMAHFAVRGLMHEAALKADEDPDQLSFLHAVRVIRRKLPAFVAIPPSAENEFS